jgi:hypothetical protein
MVQFRRLDPLANASPWQRALKRPVKSFTLTEEQYDRVQQRRPELIISEGESTVVGLPLRDVLEIHYAFPDVAAFRNGFKELFERCTAASSREEAPRGVVVSFRDRPNRGLAEQLFWESTMEEGSHWVEMDWPAAPEIDEPSNELEGGYQVSEASDADREAIASIEAGATGQTRLSERGLDSVIENARWLRLVSDQGGKPVAYLSMRREPAGWGIIDNAFILPSEEEKLREPLLRWATAFLRNNGGRRQRRRINLDQTAELAILRAIGFMPGESGVDYYRPVEAADVKQRVDERQAHGTLIKFGDWR